MIVLMGDIIHRHQMTLSFCVTCTDRAITILSIHPNKITMDVKALSPSLHAPLAEANPRLRPVDFWRDGNAVAALLELCFEHEGIDESGHRLIHILRNYGITQSWMMQGSLGFVWAEDGHIVGNASIQRNLLRKDTWIIGNVATHPNYRGHGIARTVVQACVDLAAQRGAKQVALQVAANNPPAMQVYQKLGFVATGEVAHYRRHSVRVMPVESDPFAYEPNPRRQDLVVRKAAWHDRAAVWHLAQHNLPTGITYAEPFDASLYRLGLRWSTVNSLSGNPEQWWVAQCAVVASKPAPVHSAVRTRINYDGSEHLFELLLDDGALNATDALAAAMALGRAGLQRFADYLSKPIVATQSRPHETAHTALQLLGFQPLRQLIHMQLDV